MAEFDQIGGELHQARSEKAAAHQQLFESQERVKQLEAEQAALERSFDPQNPADERRLALLKRRLTSANGAVVKARDAHNRAIELEQSTFHRFFDFTDPRKNLSGLDDQYPILLMPLRLETRWRVAERELWVRVYPDDCSVDSFEPTLSEVEVTSGQRFWAGMWAAGGVEAQQRAAWRGLVASHGAGRAAYIIQQYLPLNPTQPTKADPEDMILVITTTQPLNAAETAALTTYWQAVWLADEDVAALNAARVALVAAVGEARADELIDAYTPQNVDEKPATKAKPDVALSVEFLAFPAPDDVPTKRNSWSQPARTNVMPDRFVLLGYRGGQTDPVINELGSQIPSPLILTPDPSADEADQVHLEDGDLVVGEEMKWVVDFDRALEVGMAFKINLKQWTDIEWQRGLSRMMVIGVRLSGGAAGGKTLLEGLIHNHHYSNKGFSLLPQGSATNNTEAEGTPFSRSEDPDDTFDNYVQGNVFFNVETDPMLKKDGQWLAEALGVSYDTLMNIPSTDQTDQAEALAMNTALYPATLGYMLRTMLKPGLTWDQVDDVRWFFRNYVSGRGQVPAIRIGGQPYGILPTTAYSKIKWFGSDRLPHAPGSIESARPFLVKLYDILGKLQPFWAQALGSVAHVDAESADDAHKLLLSILGLHPSSVDYYSRVAHGANHLYNVMNLQGQGQQFIKAYQSIRFVDNGIDIATADQTRILLNILGYPHEADPDILELIFNRTAQKLKGAVIDDRPLSEMLRIRDYALPKAAGDPKRNYLEWLVDAASTSFETLRLEAGFIDNKAPTALLYLVMRYAMMQSYWKTTIDYHRSIASNVAFDVEAARSEPQFINISQSAKVSESRFTPMYAQVAGVTDPNIPNDTLVNAIPRHLRTHWQTRHLSEIIDSAAALANIPTARLERLFAEHIDLCSYRLDAWQQGFVRYQLSAMRGWHYNPQNETPGGVYIGAYGWLENVKPENKALTPMRLPNDLREVFDPLDDAGAPRNRTPIMHDPTNQGYIHAPSLNHAVTAAVLRNGYNATASPTARESMAVNLSSERVRLALSFIEGIRNGQSLSALLGYQLERGLHDNNSFAEVDTFIYKLRKEFPLMAGKLKLPIDPVTGAADPDVAPIEAQEARNVVDGLALINHIKQTGVTTYPFNRPKLPPATPAQALVINNEVNRLLDIHDALADLAMAEGVHQVVQGNYDRAGATMDAYSRGNFPPIPDVIQTPRSGITLTHRVGLHFEPGLNFNTSPVAGISMTPRASAEPAINKWLSTVLPATPADVICKAVITDPVTAAQTTFTISWADLALQPIDLLYLIQPENQQAMTELDDRIIRHLVAVANPRPDAKIEIRYAEPQRPQYSFFELAPLMQSLRSLILSSRPLLPTDVAITTEAKDKQDDTISANRPRLEFVRDALQTLHTDLTTFTAPLEAIFADLDNQRATLLANVDAYMDSFNTLLDRASRLTLPQSGWGFTYAWKANTFASLIEQVQALVDRWTTRLADFDAAMTAYAALPPLAEDDERFTLLQQAELLVSTALTDPRPDTPADLEAALVAKRAAFDAKRGQFAALLATNTTSITALLNAVVALLPTDTFDATVLDIAAVENQIVTFCGDLLRVAAGLATDADKRLTAAQTAFDAHTAAATSKDMVEALKQAAAALLGDDFRIVPEFTLLATQGSEWEKAYTAGSSNELLRFQMDERLVDFPVDDWLYGVARVREKLHHWERVVMLAGAFTGDEPDLVPVQLPYRANDSWLALEYPGDPAFVVDSERLLYTAHYPLGFSKNAAQCGLLLDEWTEILPLTEETTGLTFHYDRPSTEPPQVMLLVTPPDHIGRWQWDDLVAALHETLNLAKQRAVEPAQLEANSSALNRLLPATLMALTLREVSISGNLAVNNHVTDFVRRSVQ
ncbi:MAG: hypothetical protein LCI00_10690 [Chloroflexi bacterium]|nr:hypothetical protein [Chloroflexota bacterium]MCC6892094.1 hypothetical protein [Anaerolineae bacterium]